MCGKHSTGLNRNHDPFACFCFDAITTTWSSLTFNKRGQSFPYTGNRYFHQFRDVIGALVDINTLVLVVMEETDKLEMKASAPPAVDTSSDADIITGDETIGGKSNAKLYIFLFLTWFLKLKFLELEQFILNFISSLLPLGIDLDSMSPFKRKDRQPISKNQNQLLVLASSVKMCYFMLLFLPLLLIKKQYLILPRPFQMSHKNSI